MLTDIRQLGGRNIYFPFLDDKLGVKESVRSNADWLVFYTFFADRVLLPPSAAFDGVNALSNLKMLRLIKPISVLAAEGAIVSTSSKQQVRDFRDLFEAYSGITANRNLFPSDILVFGRDEYFQRKIYSDHLAKRLPKKLSFSLSESRELLRILAEMPRHEDFETLARASVPRINSELSKFFIETRIAYFLGGAAGGNAITPPVWESDPHEHFDFFYSKNVLLPLKLDLERQVGNSLPLLEAKTLLRLRSNLRVFSEQYYRLSIKHKEAFNIVATNIASESRLRIPLIMLQAAIATAISVALSPIFGLLATGVAIGAKFVWESFSKSAKISERMTDQARSIVVRMGLMRPHEKELLEAIESFQKGVASVGR
jgi:hypothetical protein